MSTKKKKGVNPILAVLTGVVVGAGTVLGGIVAVKEKGNIKGLVNGLSGKKSGKK